MNIGAPAGNKLIKYISNHWDVLDKLLDRLAYDNILIDVRETLWDNIGGVNIIERSSYFMDRSVEIKILRYEHR